VSVIGVCVVVSGTTARSTPQQSTAPPDKTFIQTFRAIDTAIRDLGPASSDYRQVLSRTLTALPNGAPDEIKARIANFMARAPAGAARFPCNAEFVRSRARALMLGLRDALLAHIPLRIEPAVCYAVPYAIDARQPRASAGHVDIYGFDLESTPPQVVLVTTDSTRDVTSALVASSDTHLTLDLNRIPLASASQSIELAWGHVIRHSIVVIQATTPVCSSRVETIPAGRTIADALAPIGGDARVPRDGTSIWADTMLDYSNNKLEAVVCTTADHAGSGTILSSCRTEFLYTTDPDRVIEGILERPGPVGRWTFTGFSQSRLDSSDVSFSVRLDEIKIVSTPNGSCVSPIAYREAERLHELSPATKRALDAQFRRIDPRIRSLHPRFTPHLP
jgi:hypothetical protein